MKFSNGCWLDKQGYKVVSPQEIYSTKIEEDILTIYAPCNKINTRGDTLGGPVITYKISSPMENVIRVRAYHYMWKQKKGPSFDIYENENTKVSIEDNENDVLFKSGNLKMVMNKDLWEMSFYKGDKKLTSSTFKSLAYVKTSEERTFMKVADDNAFMREELQLAVGELVYGLGERFTPLVKNGQSIDIWNEDGGTSTEQSYKNIPFYMTNKGYGVFVNHPEKVSFEVGSEKVSKVQFSVPGECLDYFIIGGESMKEVVENYTTLTGKPALPPAWSFGLWLTTSFTTNYDEATVNSFIDGMAERQLPLHVFHFDCFWMKAFQWCDFEWDPATFPDPKGMLQRLKARGLKICVWINPYIGQKSPLFHEGKEKGYLLKRPDGRVWQWDKWQAGMGIVDFTNPEASAWYAGHLKRLVDMGVDCFKTDFGERIPTDVVWHDGCDPQKMHNHYAFVYNKLVYETLQ